MENRSTTGQGPDRTRRRLLARLGLGLATAYVAPALTGFDSARASGGSGGSGGSGRGSRGGSRPGGTARRQPPQQPKKKAAPPPPELVLLLTAPPPDPQPAERLSAANYRIMQETTLAGGRLYRLGLPPGRDVPEALADLAQLFPGAVADRNGLYSPDDFLCPDEGCAAHTAIGWTGWPRGIAPRIGMIDTGINPDHLALKGQKLTIHSPDPGGRVAAGRQHGTAVAALLIGAADSRTPGLLPEAELFAVEAFHRGSGGDAADAFALAAAIDHLLGRNVSVINMSFSGPENAVLYALVQRAARQGIGLVAAAGNGGPGAAPSYPAAWPEVIAVTAVDSGLNAWRQASRGPHIAFAAPGVGLWTAASVSGGRLRSGTSYAAPFVTALLAAERARDPATDLAGHRQRLADCARDLGEPGPDEIFGHGFISTPDQCPAGNSENNSPLFNVSGE
ncbi:S8 family serine peptidase [Pseudogemmobacter bohemicus]|uniref:S8 family serine peptidase n=1 Tax=Pseudogemmobacter bohemicus TaxID=2250708 RepID=UPI000DD3C175|nr:S8 family serine peptidase [Pseudogemmobacter bohemicus]